MAVNLDIAVINIMVSTRHELSKAGHLLQEDAPEKMIAIITDFLHKNP